MPRPQPKPLIWLGNSLEAICAFTPEARREAGHQLNRVQHGQEPGDWKPLEIVGAGVQEIRIRMDKAYRVLYLAKLPEAIYVLHGFEKKTQRTSKTDIELARKRYRELMNERKPR